jgi:hypothetical protein
MGTRYHFVLVTRPPPHILFLYGVAIFSSAFLLFLIQPILAKLILPWFGGSAAVWITCLVFYQVALLAGYSYANFIATRLTPTMQAVVHSTLLAAALAFLPAIPADHWKPLADSHPAARIFLLLIAVLGLPYFALSATSPLLQSWYSRRWTDPYRLFALSNAGALLALFLYPILIEPRVPTKSQDAAWSIAFAAFAILCASIAWLSRAPRGEIQPSRPQSRWTWIALAAAGSMFLVATTNQLTENVAAVPLLWIIPLAIYLITFILCFESDRWYRRGLILRLLVMSLGAAGYAIYDIQLSESLFITIPIFAATLFLACMFCHGELAQRKPPPEGLTNFYLMIALGGALGAIFAGLLAPLIFSGVYELPFALLIVTLLALALEWQAQEAAGAGVQERGQTTLSPTAKATKTGSGLRWTERSVPFLERTERSGAPSILLPSGVSPLPATSQWSQRLLWLVATIAMAMVIIAQFRGYHQNAILLERNFYGSLRVVESNGARTLFHGTIKHGSQFLVDARRRWPTTYYGFPSGIGLALTNCCAREKRVGVIGLGAGTLATYGAPGDQFVFYDINPAIVAIAESQFSFLRDSRAKIEIVQGDARLSLERDPPRHFDVLAVDAFSGDAIPVHLLTKESFAVYLRHLAPEGIIAFHVSNQFLDLSPIVRSIAGTYGFESVEIHSDRDDDRGLANSTWVLATRNRDFLARGEIWGASHPITRHTLRPWTDDYNNLFDALRIKDP